MTSKRPSFPISTTIQKMGLIGLRWTVCSLPERVALMFGSRIGDLLRLLLSKKRRIIRDNLSKCNLILSSGESPRDFERKIFRHFGVLGVEFLRMKVLSDEALRERFSGWVGINHLQKELERGRGAIVFSGHIGNWEMVIRRIGLDFPSRTHTLIRAIKNPVVHDFVVQHRLLYGEGASTLSDLGVRPLIRALSRGEIVNIVIDQCAGASEGEFVPFFGRSACTYSSLAKLSFSLKIPVIPALSYRLPDGIHHHAVFAPPIFPMLDLPRDEAIYRQTALYSKFLEEAIREHPEQWIWMHRRWKTRNPGPDRRSFT